MINLTKITLLNFFLILFSYKLLANTYNLLSEDVDITVSAPFSFQKIDSVSQQKIYNKTNNKHIETYNNDEVFHEMWVENGYLDKISEKVFPTMLIIQSNKKNIFTKEQFLSSINNKLENNKDKFQKIWIDGYRIYTRNFNIKFEENDYFYENSNDIIKNQAVILLPENRFATISIFSDKIISNEDLENFIKIFPRYSLEDLAKLLGDENVYGEDSDNFENEFTRNVAELIQIQNYYSDLLQEITLIRSELMTQMYTNINEYQNANIDLTNFYNNFNNSSKILNEKIYKIKNKYKSYERKDFSNWMDGRYNYILSKFEYYIENLFVEFENEFSIYSETVKSVSDDPNTDLLNKLVSLEYSSSLNDLKHQQSLIKINQNLTISDQSPTLTITKISTELYQLHINCLNFLYDVYQYGTDYAPIFYLTLLRENKVAHNNIDLAFKFADQKIIQYEEYIFNILNKLRNNDSVLQISSQMFDKFYLQLELYERLYYEYKNLEENYPFITEFSDYSNYFDSYMNVDTFFSNTIYELGIIQEELRILGLKYNEEMKKL